MLLLLPITFLVGIIAAMVEAGGGVFIVPLLSLILDFFHQAIGTSLATIILTSLSSTIGYRRQMRTDYKVGTLLTAITIPGAFVGGIPHHPCHNESPRTYFRVLSDSHCLTHDL